MEVDTAVIEKLEGFLGRVAASYAPDLKVLAALRIAFGVWVIALPVDTTWITRVPADFFRPRPGLFFYLSSPPSETFLSLLAIATAVLALLVAVGILTTPASIGLTIAMVVGSGVSYSYSKVDHFILFELAPLFLTYAGWGKAVSIDSLIADRRGRGTAEVARGMPVLLYAMTIGWGMLTAAVPKVMNGWLDPHRQASRGYLARDLAFNEKLGPLGPTAIKLDSTVFWKLLDYGTIIAEAGLILFVFFPLIFRIWLVLLASFHVGVYLVLGISFIDYVFVYAVFFSPVIVGLANRALAVRGGRRPTPVRT